MRTITLKNVMLTPGDRPLVECWAPGMRNVPLDVRMGGLKAQLSELGLISQDREVRTGLLSGPWKDFPRHALVIWAGPGHGEEWIAVSDEPAATAD